MSNENIGSNKLGLYLETVFSYKSLYFYRIAPWCLTESVKLFASLEKHQKTNLSLSDLDTLEDLGQMLQNFLLS
jgi:hypothetical protein